MAQKFADRQQNSNSHPNRVFYPPANTPEEREAMGRILWQKLKESGEIKDSIDPFGEAS
nr:hypothetical protein [Kovacikia minuta]